LKLSGKRTVTGQNSGELYTKKHRRGNSHIFRNDLTEFALKVFPIFFGKNLSGKRTEEE